MDFLTHRAAPNIGGMQRLSGLELLPDLWDLADKFKSGLDELLAAKP